MKKKIVIGLISGMMLASTPLNVYAAGSATVNFKSNDRVEVGEDIKVYMSIEDIKDASKGIVGVEAVLDFDKEELELIEAKEVNTPYDFWYSTELNKVVGLDFTFDNAINKDTVLYEFTFKALKAGETNITLKDVELSSTAKGKDSLVSTIVYGKNITINEKKEVEVVEEVKSVNKEVFKTEEKIVKKEISNKEKLVKVNEVVHGLLKKLSNLL